LTEVDTLIAQLLDPVAHGHQQAGPYTIDNQAKSNWQFLIGPNNVGPLYELTMAGGRTLTYHIDDSASATFTVTVDDPNLLYITELVTDLWVYRNGKLHFRGRIGASTDTLDGEADTYEVNFTAFDYREWLVRQLLQPSRKWSWKNTTQAQIITDLFTYAINGQAGIHPTWHMNLSGMPTSKVNFDVTPGTSVKETLGTMSGFGWQVYPDSVLGLTLKAMTPFYYQYNPNFILQYGSTVSKITRTYDTGGYANSVIETGDMNLAPVQADAPGIATMPQGRLARVLSNPAIVDKTHLQRAAASASTTALAVAPTWSCDLASNVWDDMTYAWIGDICKFIAKRGRININDQYRITDINININDDSEVGSDNVTITVVKPANLP
jgi:hypothetical protein